MEAITLQAAVEVRAAHQPRWRLWGKASRCRACSGRWPCSTWFGARATIMEALRDAWTGAE